MFDTCRHVVRKLELLDRNTNTYIWNNGGSPIGSNDMSKPINIRQIRTMLTYMANFGQLRILGGPMLFFFPAFLNSLQQIQTQLQLILISASTGSGPPSRAQMSTQRSLRGFGLIVRSSRGLDARVRAHISMFGLSEASKSTVSM